MKKIGLSFIPLFILGILWLTGCFDKKNPEVIDDCISPEDCAVNESIAENLSNKYLTAFGTEPFWDIEISGGVAHLSSPMYDTDYSIPVNIRREGDNYYFSGEELEGEFIKKDCIDGGKGDMHYYTVSVSKFREYAYEGCGDDEQGVKMSDEDREEDFSNFMTQFSGNIKSCENHIKDRLNMILENATDISQGWYNYTNVGDSFQAEGYIGYSVDGEYYTKDTTCTFQSSDFSDWGEYGNGEIEYRGQGNIIGLSRSDEEQECLDSLYQYEPEQMKGDSDTMITLSCYPKNFYGPEYITGYIYTTTYPDLGLKISTPAGANYLEEKNDLFSNKSEKPIFTRDGNIISYGVEYIQVYEKDKNDELEDIIKKKHLKDGCAITYYPNYYNQTKIITQYPGTIIYSIVGETDDPYSSGDPYAGESCVDGDGENHWGLVWFFEGPDKTKYYKIVFGDGCAPGPCSMFGTIELF